MLVAKSRARLDSSTGHVPTLKKFYWIRRIPNHVLGIEIVKKMKSPTATKNDDTRRRVAAIMRYSDIESRVYVVVSTSM